MRNFLARLHNRPEYPSPSHLSGTDFPAPKILKLRRRSRRKPPKRLLGRYGIQWVLWDKHRESEWDMSVLRGLHEAISSGAVALYARSRLGAN